MLDYELSPDSADSGQRIDKWLAEQSDIDLSRSAVAKLIEAGNITICGRAVSKSYKISWGDIIGVHIPDPVDADILPEDIPLDVVYEDQHLLVVNKQQGMVVHPAAGNYSGTLVNALIFKYRDQLSGINGVIRPGIVHRIDKNTSGLLIVAKTDKAHIGLAEQIKAHSFTREYEAISVGRFKEKSGTIDAPIGRHKTDRKKMCVTETNSKSAVTHYDVLDEMGNYSYMRFRLETGRTHQIRVHSAYIGHPILGDDVYGKAYKGCNGQCLHAKKIGFIHPISGDYLEFSSPLPEYFEKLLVTLR